MPSTLEETARPTGDNTRHTRAVKHQPRQYCLIIFVRRQNFGLSFAIHRERGAICQNVSLKEKVKMYQNVSLKEKVKMYEILTGECALVNNVKISGPSCSNDR